MSLAYGVELLHGMIQVRRIVIEAHAATSALAHQTVDAHELTRVLRALSLLGDAAATNALSFVGEPRGHKRMLEQRTTHWMHRVATRLTVEYVTLFAHERRLGSLTYRAHLASGRGCLLLLGVGKAVDYVLEAGVLGERVHARLVHVDEARAFGTRQISGVESCQW